MRPSTQEEEDMDIIRSWVEVGGLPAHQEGEAKELLSEVNHIPISLSFLLLSTCLPPISLIIYTIFGCYALFSSFFAGVEIAPGGQ